MSWTLVVYPDAPSHGLSCWDLNENHEPDPSTEDVNSDGSVDVLDCRGTDGDDGQDGTDAQDGLDGLSCWDQDGDGHADPEADLANLSVRSSATFNSLDITRNARCTGG